MSCRKLPRPPFAVVRSRAPSAALGMALVVVLASSSACSEEGMLTPAPRADAGLVPDASAKDAAASDAASPDSAAPIGPPTFAAIYEQILLPHHCDSYLCHGANAGGLDLTTPEVAYADLVDAPSTGLDCRDTGLARVLPNQPEQSLLYLKLFESPPCGYPMPPSFMGLLPDEQRARIREWILAGAPN